MTAKSATAFLQHLHRNRHRDTAVFIMQISKDFCENMDRVGSSAAKEARMQIAVSSLDDDFLANQTAKADADCWCFFVPHGGVADQCHVGL